MEPLPHDHSEKIVSTENSAESPQHEVMHFSLKVLESDRAISRELDHRRVNAEQSRNLHLAEAALRDEQRLDAAAHQLESANATTQAESAKWPAELGGQYARQEWQTIENALSTNQVALEQMAARAASVSEADYPAQQVEDLVEVTAKQTHLEQNVSQLLQHEMQTATESAEAPTEQQMTARIENIGQKWQAPGSYTIAEPAQVPQDAAEPALDVATWHASAAAQQPTPASPPPLTAHSASSTSRKWLLGMGIIVVVLIAALFLLTL